MRKPAEKRPVFVVLQAGCGAREKALQQLCKVAGLPLQIQRTRKSKNGVAWRIYTLCNAVFMCLCKNVEMWKKQLKKDCRQPRLLSEPSVQTRTLGIHLHTFDATIFFVAI